MRIATYAGGVIVVALLTAATARGVVIQVPALTEALSGESADLFVTLFSEDAEVASAENDLAVPPPVSVRAKRDGTPDCEDRTHTNPGVFSFLPAGCAGSACTGIRAAVTIGEPIPIGRPIYECVIDVAAETPPGFYPVEVTAAAAFDGDGAPLPTTSQNGAVAVPELPKRAILIVDDVEAQPGELVTFTVSIETSTAAQITEISNLIELDPPTRIASDDAGTPRCALDPASEQPAIFDCDPSESCNVLLADAGSQVDPMPFPSGSVVYTCTAAIPAATSPGVYALFCPMARAVDYNSGPVSTQCTSGAIHVRSLPSATPTDTPGPLTTATPRSAHDHGCAVVGARRFVAWPIVPPLIAIVWRRRRARRTAEFPPP